VKRLQQKYDNDDLITVRASPNYHINENKQVHEYKIIESVNDLLHIFKQPRMKNKLLI